MDAALFLLDQGVHPDHITWIMSNDAWLLDRAQIQPGQMTKEGFGSQLLWRIVARRGRPGCKEQSGKRQR